MPYVYIMCVRVRTHTHDVHIIKPLGLLVSGAFPISCLSFEYNSYVWL